MSHIANICRRILENKQMIKRCESDLIRIHETFEKKF